MRALPFAAVALVTIWLSARGYGDTLVALACIGLNILVGFVAIALPPAKANVHRWITRAAICGLIIISMTVIATHWPLRTMYRLSYGEFERVAFEIQSGETIDSPRRVGWFTIRKGEMNYRGVVCLWTDLEPSGYTGFARGSRAQVDKNLWSLVVLDDQWKFISED